MVVFVFDMGWVRRAARAAVAASGDAAAETGEQNQDDHEADRAAVVMVIVAAVFGALVVLVLGVPAASVLVVPLALRRAAAGGWCDGLRFVRSVVRWVVVRVGEPGEDGRIWRYTMYSLCTPVSFAMPSEQVQRSSCEPAQQSVPLKLLAPKSGLVHQFWLHSPTLA